MDIETVEDLRRAAAQMGVALPPAGDDGPHGYH